MLTGSVSLTNSKGECTRKMRLIKKQNNEHRSLYMDMMSGH